MNKNTLDQLDATIALIAAYNLIEYAKEQNAYAMRGGDHYIETGLVIRALCQALGLDYYHATRTVLDEAIEAFKNGGMK